jgi:hypothetical protein
MLSVPITAPTCAQRSRGRARATSAMNARRWAEIHARGNVMMRAPSSAVGLMPPMLAPAVRARMIPWGAARARLERQGDAELAGSDAPRAL